MKFLTAIICVTGTLFFVRCNAGKDEKIMTPEQKIAAVSKAYGMDSIPYLNKLSFTFNIQKDTVSIARHWVWDVKNNVVTLTSDKENITYNRDSLQTAEMKKADEKFINDQYWLLFPWHAAHDSGVTYIMKDSMLSPGAQLLTTKFTVQYNKEDGYTPGDAYDLYLDIDNMIKEWSYRPGGALEPAMSTTWEGNTKFGGITLPMDHKNAKGDFRLFFTGVMVE